MKPNLKRIVVLAAAGTALAASNAGAANSFYAPGDLVLYFQKEGASNTVYASLGNTALHFRGSSIGTSGGDTFFTRTNIINLNSTLVNAFGNNWATDPSIYAGLAGVWGTSTTSSLMQNQDPHRTLYVSSPRNSVGTVGTADSLAWNLVAAGNTAMNSGANGITGQNSAFETNGSLQAQVLDTTLSQIDNQNPFSSPGIQGNAFNGAFAGGVQQQGSAGTFGDFTAAPTITGAPLDGVGNVEFALDLYRIAARTNITGQAGFGDTARVGSFEGTVVVGSDGNVSFLVPEPSTSILAGLAAGAFVMRRRRNA